MSGWAAFLRSSSNKSFRQMGGKSRIILAESNMIFVYFQSIYFLQQMQMTIAIVKPASSYTVIVSPEKFWKMDYVLHPLFNIILIEWVGYEDLSRLRWFDGVRLISNGLNMHAWKKPGIKNTFCRLVNFFIQNDTWQAYATTICVFRNIKTKTLKTITLSMMSKHTFCVEKACPAFL